LWGNLRADAWAGSGQRPLLARQSFVPGPDFPVRRFGQVAFDDAIVGQVLRRRILVGRGTIVDVISSFCTASKRVDAVILAIAWFSAVLAAVVVRAERFDRTVILAIARFSTVLAAVVVRAA